MLPNRPEEERIASQQWMSPWISLRNGENGLIDADIGPPFSFSQGDGGEPSEPDGKMCGNVAF